MRVGLAAFLCGPRAFAVRSVFAVQEIPQQGQGLDIFVQVLALGRLEQHRQIGKPWIVDQPAKGLDPDRSFSEMFVPVAGAVQIYLGIVEVKAAQPV